MTKQEVKEKRTCQRCNVELEELAVVDIGFRVDLNNPVGVLAMMLWGGEVRRYSAYECPKCEELFFFREH